MNYTLRPVNESDRPWLDQLCRQVYRDLFFATWGRWDDDRHIRHFASCWERGNIQIIKVDAVSVGMIQVFDLDDQIEIAEIQIAPDFQGQGLATMMINDILINAKRKQKKVTLSSGLQNLGALRLYARLGFTEVKRTELKVYLEQ
jgi:ribosomal protein S18 acetylase RimI-like enzyme